jgi:FKBP-type peptidyl-prolyl cis-trans isomerase (trigger factor)
MKEINKTNFLTKIEKLDNSRVKVTVTVKSVDFEKFFEGAKEKVLSDAKLNGFRDGKVPYGAYVKAYGEFPIRQEMGYMAVDQTYVNAIIKDKIEAIGKPEIAILKVTKGEDFEYQIQTDVLPQVVLGDYKKYHKEVKLDEVEKAKPDEVNNALEELRRMRITKNEKGEEVVPELDDRFLKSVGDFQTVEDLKKRIEENMNKEKTWRAEEKKKGQIFEHLIADTKTEIPNSLVENELSKLEDRIKADLAQMGVGFEDYLKHMKKTLAEWQESEKVTAKKNVVLQLALHEISKKENIKVSENTLNNEVSHLLQQYKDIDMNRAKAYTEEKMTNSLVAEYLFTGKVPDEVELFGSHEGHSH